MSRHFFVHRPWVVTAVLGLMSLAVLSVALADDADPPSRVARLSLAEGSVSIQPAGVNDWATAAVNRPLTTGDKLWTDQNSRAELDLGSAAIRLGGTTGFSLLNLDDRTTQMNVSAGTALVHVQDFGQNQTFEIDTPNVAVTLQSPGDYRVEVNDAGDTTVVKVSNGDAEVAATGQNVPVHTQQAYTFTGTNQVTAQAVSLGAPDDLDQWSLDRDHREEQAAQANDYVSPDVAGAEDLNQYGNWESTPDYGPVWVPTAVAPGWAPYQYGQWVWVAPWGWTWVDEAPWGFAPFHYGRWAYFGDRWCWVPGPRHVRPVYAPALVAWVGSPGVGAALAVGGVAAVGWFALGPREVYVPGYHVSETYVRNVNVTNTTIVNNTYITNVYQNKVTNINYVNRDKPGAVAAVPQNVFTSAQPIRGHVERIPPAEVSRYGVSGSTPAIAPVRESVLASRPNTYVRRPPAALATRPVVARVAPPPAPVPFEKQQAAIRANGNRPLARAQLSQLQPSAPTTKVRLVTPGPASSNPQRAGVNRPPQAPQQSWQDRERALHNSTQLPPSQQREPPGSSSSGGSATQGGLRTDRPPGAWQGRQNDQYRLPQNGSSRSEPQGRPEARPLPQARPLPEARPAEPPRNEYRTAPREETQPRPEARPYEAPPPRVEQRSVESPPPRFETREAEPQRENPVARPVEPPRPAPQAKPTPPPQSARPEERKGKPGEPNPHFNR